MDYEKSTYSISEERTYRQRQGNILIQTAGQDTLYI